MYSRTALRAGLFDGDETATLPISHTRRAYVHVAVGEVTVNGTPLKAGDALKIENTAEVTLRDGRSAEVLVFDLPGEDET